MRETKAFYRGYGIHVSGADASWASRTEPMRPELPIVSVPFSEGHASWGKALNKAKRQIDALLSE
jgi:hypothetical protein